MFADFKQKVVRQLIEEYHAERSKAGRPSGDHPVRLADSSTLHREGATHRCSGKQDPEDATSVPTPLGDRKFPKKRLHVFNISRLKPYHSRAESAPAEDEATQPASPVHARDAQAPNDARSDAGNAKDDSDDEEFQDALDTPPEDATMPARPRRSVMPHQRDDFVYY
ncbi:hypothetical protein MTO96_044433 [Rhipicephalus appendiculatus]